MFPPSGGYNLDVEAISGICGSISIGELFRKNACSGLWSSNVYTACWVVVFSPQIIENFRRSSAEGLSIEFIIIWLAGDFANIIGAVMQGVLPTMVSSTKYGYACDRKLISLDHSCHLLYSGRYCPSGPMLLLQGRPL